MTTAHRVKQTIARFTGRDESEVSGEKRITEDLGCSSLEQVELCMEIEDQFAVEIDDDAMAELVTVQHFIDYVAKNAR
jgi:acyl carrier protein